MIDDAELLRRYVETRSEAAFAELVHRHMGWIYRSALRRVGGRSDWAQDITQYVFIAMAKQSSALVRRLAAFHEQAQRNQATEAGMSSEQEEAITQLAVQTLPPQAGASDQPLDPARVDWDRVLGRAAAWLTAEQLGSIKAEVDSAHFVALMHQFYAGRMAAAK